VNDDRIGKNPCRIDQGGCRANARAAVRFVAGALRARLA
jgi:hypothetical protein